MRDQIPTGFGNSASSAESITALWDIPILLKEDCGTRKDALEGVHLLNVLAIG